MAALQLYVYDIANILDVMNPEEGALMCVTDLEDCCDAPRTVRGD